MLPGLDVSAPWASVSQVASGRLAMAAGNLLRGPDLASVRGDDPLTAPWVRCLDGTWALGVWPSPDAVPLDALTGPREGDGWGTVPVPGTWLLHAQGVDPLGVPHYTNIQMPFAGPPFRLPDHNPTAVHRRRVEVPASWSDLDVVLRVGAAETFHAVYVDGHFVGHGTDSHLPSDYDITHLIPPGHSAEVAIVVVRYAAASYLEDQDHWWMGGLQRSVTLHARPRVRIADAAVLADWDPATSSARLTLDVEVAGLATLVDRAEGWWVRAWVETLGGGSPRRPRRLGEIVAGTVPHRFDDPYRFTGHRVRGEAPIPGARPWNAEDPVLYRVVMELVDPQGSVVEVASCRVGFRRVEIRDRNLLVNGERIMIRGVNRHDHHPDRGPAMTPEDLRDDVVAMKRLNLNAIRTAHYPPDTALLSLCDELGMYVVDEADIETHAYNTSLGDDPAVLAAWMERTVRMVRRDRNHPCVILWSLGNESGLTAAHRAQAAWIRAADPTRPLHYEGAVFHAGWVDGALEVSDLVAPMYPPVEQIAQYGRSGRGERPLVVCEYSHAMGNSNGGLARYSEIFETTPGVQGGFVWEWKDHGLRQRVEPPGPGGAERFAYGGQFGDAPHDGNFCADGIMGPDLVAHPAAWELAWVHRPVAVTGPSRWRPGSPFVLVLTSRRHFVDTSDLIGRIEIAHEGHRVTAWPLDVVLSPGERRRVEIPAATFAEAATASGDLTVTITWRQRRATAWAPRGHVVGTDQILARRARSPVPVRWPSRTSRWARVPASEVLDVMGGVAPRLSLWRAPVDNDRFLALPDSRRLETELEMRTSRRDEEWGVTWRHELDLAPEHADVARVGSTFDLPEGDWELHVYGRGPHENLPDRSAAAHLLIWSQSPDEVPYLRPQSHGLRTDCRWMVALDRSRGIAVALEAIGPVALHMSATPHDDEELARARDLSELGPRRSLTLHVDRAHRGVGTASCGPDTDPEFRIGPGRYRWAYRISARRRRTR